MKYVANGRKSLTTAEGTEPLDLQEAIFAQGDLGGLILYHRTGPTSAMAGSRI